MVSPPLILPLFIPVSAVFQRQKFGHVTLNPVRSLPLPQEYSSNSAAKKIVSSRCGPCLPFVPLKASHPPILLNHCVFLYILQQVVLCTKSPHAPLFCSPLTTCSLLSNLSVSSCRKPLLTFLLSSHQERMTSLLYGPCASHCHASHVTVTIGWFYLHSKLIKKRNYAFFDSAFMAQKLADIWLSVNVYWIN